MKKDDFKTAVVFRKFPEGDIIALFPYDIYSSGRLDIMSYMHIGQHGMAEYWACMKNTKLAKPNEYQELQRELESLGYNLQILKRRNYNKFLNAYYKAKRA